MRLVRLVFFLLSLSQEYSFSSSVVTARTLLFNLVALVTRGWVVFDIGMVSWEDLVNSLKMPWILDHYLEHPWKSMTMHKRIDARLKHIGLSYPKWEIE